MKHQCELEVLTFCSDPWSVSVCHSSRALNNHVHGTIESKGTTLFVRSVSCAIVTSNESVCIQIVYGKQQKLDGEADHIREE